MRWSDVQVSCQVMGIEGRHSLMETEGRRSRLGRKTDDCSLVYVDFDVLEDIWGKFGGRVTRGQSITEEGHRALSPTRDPSEG